MTTNEMIMNLRDMASQILSPHSEGQKLFVGIAERLAAHQGDCFLALEFGFKEHEKGHNLEMARMEYAKLLNE